MKPARRWLAFLLNLVFTPAGYVYVGAWRWAAALIGALLVLMVVLSVWTFRSPPGVYDWPGMPAEMPGLSPYGLVLGLAVAAHAAALAGKVSARPTGIRLWILGAAGPLLILAAGGALRAFAPVSVYSMASASNQPTLTAGDIVAVWGARAFCGRARPEAGDLVVYRRQDDPSTRYMHRVVALSGDTVEVRQGRLIINGAPARLQATGRTFDTGWGMKETILRETPPVGRSHEVADMLENGDGDTFAATKVPAGHVFIMGDNRDNALDSRFEGPVPLTDVCGVVFKVLKANDRSHIGQRP